jgi:hypothetical protein
MCNAPPRFFEYSKTLFDAGRSMPTIEIRLLMTMASDWCRLEEDPHPQAAEHATFYLAPRSVISLQRTSYFVKYCTSSSS